MGCRQNGHPSASFGISSRRTSPLLPLPDSSCFEGPEPPEGHQKSRVGDLDKKKPVAHGEEKGSKG
jgi:hypothetical protein